MSKSAVLNIRLEPKQKNNIEKIFKKLGLNVADAVRIFFAKVENENGIPFDVKIPNKKLQKSLKEVELGIGISKAKSLKDIIK